MTHIELLNAFVAKTLNMAPESVAELLYKKSDDGTITDELNEGAIDALTSLDRERVAKLKPDTKAFFDNGYKKAQAEVSEKYEKMIREKTGIETDLVGEELVSAGIAHVSKPGKMDDDKVKVHPLFLSLEKSSREMLEAERTASAKALADFQAGHKKEQLTSSAQQRAKDILLSMKPVLEDDARIADRRIKYFLDEFKALDYEAQEDGSLVPIRDGKRLENEHMHPIGFEQLVKNIATESFKFQVQDPKGNAGNKNDNQPGEKARVSAPSNEDELWQAYNSEATQEGKKAIIEAYELKNGVIAL